MLFRSLIRNFELCSKFLDKPSETSFVVLSLDNFKSKTSFYLELFSLIRNSELRSKLLSFGKSKLKTSFYLLFRSLIRNFVLEINAFVMQLSLVILSAIAPVAVLLWYIIKKDSAQPEPAKWLIRAFCYGMLSVLLSLIFTAPATMLGASISSEQYTSVLYAFGDAFALAAVPEEVAKFTLLWLLLCKNPFFDENFDGIVYAVCVGMGFAGVENVMYLLGGLENGLWISIGVTRALFAVPGHFLFAVLMGYYYSIWHFNIDRSIKTGIMILAAPILAHGIYDGILFSLHMNAFFSAVGMIAFLYFFNKLRNVGKEKISRLMGG